MKKICLVVVLSALLGLGCTVSPADGTLFQFTSDTITFTGAAPTQGADVFVYAGIPDESKVGQCKANTFWQTDSAGMNWYTCTISLRLPRAKWLPISDPLRPSWAVPPPGAKFYTIFGMVANHSSWPASPGGGMWPMASFAQDGRCVQEAAAANLSGLVMRTKCGLTATFGDTVGFRRAALFSKNSDEIR